MRISVVLFLLGSVFAVQAQNTPGFEWTLEKCIEYAISHNLDVKQAEINAEQAKINYDQTKWNLLPDLNGSAGQYFQAGRNIDRFTNTAVQSTIKNNNFSLSSGVLLFAGGQLRNSMMSGKYSWLASEEDLHNVEMNISLNVANLFLQIAQARELVKSSKENVNNTAAQLDRAGKQYQAGAINEGLVLNLKAQKANDEATLINAQNQERTALTNLKLLLRLPIEQNFEVSLPVIGSLDTIAYPETVNSIYDSAIARRPDIKAADLRISSANSRKKATAGALYPTLSLGATASTVYSSSAKEITGYNLSNPFEIGRVQNTNESVITQQPVYTYATSSFNKQLKNNFGQSLGLSLSVPIFGKMQGQNNYKLAQLDLEKSKLNAEKVKQNLYNEIVGVYTAFESAMNRYRAAQYSYDAQSMNLKFVQKRFEGGQSSATELQLAKASESVSRVNLVSLKYEYLFRKMVLDFYMGKKLELN